MEAIAWLASKSAEPYFDFLDLPQSRLLSRCGWKEWAREAYFTTCPPEYNEVLFTTLEYLNDLSTPPTP